MEKEGDKNVQTVVRAMRLLSQMTLREQTLTELAEQASVAVPTALRLLRTLEAMGYVHRASDGSFSVGPALLGLTLTIDRNSVIGSLVRSTLGNLRDRFDESTAFFVQDGDELLCVGSSQSTQIVRRVHPLHHRVPVYLGAAGKVFLAYGETDALLASVRQVTGGTFTRASGTEHSVDELLEVIATTRATGYALSSQEASLESWGVSAPVFLHSQLLGALCFGMPVGRRQTGQEKKLGVACREAAAQLSAELDISGEGPRRPSTTGPLHECPERHKGDS